MNKPLVQQPFEAAPAFDQPGASLTSPDRRQAPGRIGRVLAFCAALIAAGLFVASLKLPLWHLKMEAPQYQGKEALRVQVYPGSMTGDLREISVLNKYIGVRLPENLEELRWLPVILLLAAALGIGAIVLPRRARSLACFAVALFLALALLASAVLAQWQMHRIGHERNPHAALKGVHDFTPRLFGRVKVANFEISTGLGLGGWLIAAGLVLQVSAALLCRRDARASVPRTGLTGNRANPPALSPSDAVKVGHRLRTVGRKFSDVFKKAPHPTLSPSDGERVESFFGHLPRAALRPSLGASARQACLACWAIIMPSLRDFSLAHCARTGTNCVGVFIKMHT